ncbi:MAG: DUF5057 domain-containing protein [Clostridium sp.]|nr:DUF5057 domain-containing protein [Clostridium sp.]
MIVLGFADMYGNNDGNGSDITNPEVIKEIKSFIKTGQSVMFTHDTLNYDLSKTNTWGINIAEQFRDIIGQSRFVDANNPGQTNVDGTSIIHDPYPNGSNYSFGFTTGALKRANGKGFPKVYNANKINDGLINEFPFVLNNNPITIARTHYQYYQLNLEDPDVVPWYTLYDGGNSIDEADARNYYYTYSKGNITFSGTGHSSPSSSTTDEENKLFVNTMVKASRGADHAPTVVINNPSNGANISTDQNSVDFNFTASDIDSGDVLKGNVYLNNNLVKTYNSGEIQSGKPTDLEISKAQMQQYVKPNTNFTIRVDVTDEQNADGQATVNLNYEDEPGLNLSYTGNTGYLVGDEANYNLTATANKANNDLKTVMNNIQYSMDYNNPNNPNGIQLDCNSSWDIPDSTHTIKFDPNPEPAQPTTKSVKFKLNSVGNYNIANNLQYQFSNINQNEINEKNSLNIPLDVKSGILDVKVVDMNNKVIDNSGISVNVNETLSNPCDGVTSKNETPVLDKTTGTAELLDKSTGAYNVNVNLPEKYAVVKEELENEDTNTSTDITAQNMSDRNNASANLSYDAPHQQIVFKVAERPAKPNIGEMNVQGSNNEVTSNVPDSQTSVVVGAVFSDDPEYVPDNGVTLNDENKDCLVKQISLDNGANWIDYSNQTVSEGNNGTSFIVRCLDRYGISSDVASYEVDNLKPKVTVNSSSANGNITFNAVIDPSDLAKGAQFTSSDNGQYVFDLGNHQNDGSVNNHEFVTEEDLMDPQTKTMHKNITRTDVNVNSINLER